MLKITQKTKVVPFYNRFQLENDIDQYLLRLNKQVLEVVVTEIKPMSQEDGKIMFAGEWLPEHKGYASFMVSYE